MGVWKGSSLTNSKSLLMPDESLDETGNDESGASFRIMLLDDNDSDELSLPLMCLLEIRRDSWASELFANESIFVWFLVAVCVLDE
jgi:hypothetical protein